MPLPRKRTANEFRDSTKAEIYVRDRATCAFSGKSLWILDYGISPLYDIDWADHRKPRARGGSSDAENGICASSFCNSKKSSNGRDNCFLFDEGQPTHHYYWNIGEIPTHLMDQLKRLSAIQESDWHFNKAVSHLFLAATGDYYKSGYRRGHSYYRKAARRKLSTFRILRDRHGFDSIENRKLVLYPDQKDVRLLLELQHRDEDEILDEIARIYHVNLDVMQRFWICQESEPMREILEQAYTDPCFSPLVGRALESQLEFWNYQYADPQTQNRNVDRRAQPPAGSPPG